MTELQHHHWVCGDSRSGRGSVVRSLPIPDALVPTVDAHRRLRGPYTAAGTLLRAIVPDALSESPTLPTRYDIEILSAAPEIEFIMSMARTTLTSTAAVRERTRFYGADRTTQLANGMAEFLIEYLGQRNEPRSVVLENMDQADHSDQELVAILLRRVRPRLLNLVVCTGEGELQSVLADALAIHAVPHPAPCLPTPADGALSGSTSELAAAYVGSECLSENPAHALAYDSLDETALAELHDRRAEQLEARGELSLRLGAIPFHRERGTDPHAAGAGALQFAIDHCSLMGFYAATVELTARARPLVQWDRPKLNHLITARRALALIMTGRAAEAKPLYDEARLFSTDPEMHMMAAYSTAMLYTRHHAPEQLDHTKAVAWINQAIAFASTYTDPANRAFQTVFMQNGLALVESHRGNHAEALRLVEAGADRLDAELPPDEHRLHRSVLIHNSGQVRAALGQYEDAISEYTAAIEHDPHYAPYYFDRAGMLHRLGRDEEAVADYETAIQMSPPLPEAYYNRGDIRAALGDLDGALSDFGYALELTPNFVDAYLYRASVLSELGRDEEARKDVFTGLALDPNNAPLLSIRGQLDAAAGDADAAVDAFERVIELDPSIEAAWAGRGSIAFDRGDMNGALADLGKALELADSPALRFNRAAVFLATGRWDEALKDLNRAAELDPSDLDVLSERARCLRQLTSA